MNAEDVRARLRTGEDSRTELKSVSGGPPSADTVAKEITAFANSGGGDVIFGVEDDCSVTGVGSSKDAEELQRRIVQTCRDSVEPPLRTTLLVLELDGERVVVVHVPGYRPGRPFRGRSKYFVRDGPVSREATRQELAALFASVSAHYDECPVDGASRDDLDPERIEAFLARAHPPAPRGAQESYLRALKAITKEGVPTVCGVLLFADNPRAFLVDAYVSALRVPGTVLRNEFTDRRDIGGPLDEQLRESVAFLSRNVSVPAGVRGIERRDARIPEEAWREAVVNALCHRDYSVTSQTRLYVFDDRVEIANPGRLLNELTLDGIRLGGVSQRRNPYLSAAMARIGHAENIGVGVPEMFRLVRDTGYPEPEIRIESGEFRLIVRTTLASDRPG